MADECPTCGRSSRKFGKAVREVLAEFLAERQAAAAERVAEADAAAQVERDRLAAEAAEVEAATVAEARKWEGHTHDFPDEPTAGMLTCRECGFSVAADIVAQYVRAVLD